MSKADLSFIRGRRWRWLVLLIVASLPLFGWWTYGLFDLDEGFYAAVTGSMIRHNEWITPLYNGKPWFEKPILIYWLAKPAVMLFGPDVGPRLPSVLATIATYAVVAWYTRRRFGPMAGVISLFILGSSLLVVALGRMMMTDALLLFFFTTAMLAYGESLVGNPNWKLVTAACLGFAVLAKGPIALLLFLLIAGWHALDVRRYSRPTPKADRSADNATENWSASSIWSVGTLLLVAIVAAWYVPAYLANGQVFTDEFLIKQNIGRFTGGDQAHTLPLYKSFWFYVPVLIVGICPWIFWLPAAWPRPVDPTRSYNEDGNETQLVKLQLTGGTLVIAEELKKLFSTWTVIVFLFFTISSAKLPHYILPCAPPIAILVAIHLSKKWNGLTRDEMRPKLFATVAWLAIIWLIAQFGFEAWYARSGQQEAHQLARWMNADSSPQTPVAVYELTKQKGQASPPLQIQETSLPSMSFYLDRDLLEPDSLEVLEPSDTLWVFTRKGRISLDDVEGFNQMNDAKVLLPRRAGNHYEIFTLASTR